MGFEVAVGFLIAWMVGKARRAGKALDGVANEVVDASAVRVKDLLLAKLGKDSAVQQLQREAEELGKVTDRTRRRVEMALDEAAEQDPRFAAELAATIKDAKNAAGSATAAHGGIAVAGGVHGQGSGTTIGVVGGNLNQGQTPGPHQPDRA